MHTQKHTQRHAHTDTLIMLWQCLVIFNIFCDIFTKCYGIFGANSKLNGNRHKKIEKKALKI